MDGGWLCLLCNGDGLAAEAGLIRLLRPAAPVLWGKPLLFPFTFLDADGLKVSGVEDKEPEDGIEASSDVLDAAEDRMIS